MCKQQNFHCDIFHSNVFHGILDDILPHIRQLISSQWSSHQMLTDFSNEFFCRHQKNTTENKMCWEKCGPKLKNTIEIYTKNQETERENEPKLKSGSVMSLRGVCVYVFIYLFLLLLPILCWFFSSIFSFGLVSSFPFGRNSCVSLVYTVYILRQRITSSNSSSRATTTTTMKWTKNIYERRIKKNNRARTKLK